MELALQKFGTDCFSRAKSVEEKVEKINRDLRLLDHWVNFINSQQSSSSQSESCSPGFQYRFCKECYYGNKIMTLVENEINDNIGLCKDCLKKV